MYGLLNALGQKLIRLLDQPLNPHESYKSPTLRQLNEMLHFNYLSEYLPYDSYDPQTKLYHNKESVGFVLEAPPSFGITEQDHKSLLSFMRESEVMPTGSSLQVIYWASPFIDHYLDYWQTYRLESIANYDLKCGAVLKALTERRAEFLKQQAWGAWKDCVTRRAKVLIAFTQNPDTPVEEVQRHLETFQEFFRDIGVACKPMDAHSLLSTLDEMVNFYPGFHSSRKSDGRTPLAHQLITGEVTWQTEPQALLLNEGQTSIKTYTVKNQPETWSLNAMNGLFGGEDNMSPTLGCPYLVHYGFYLPPQEWLAAIANTKAANVERSMKLGLAKWLPTLEKQHAEFDFLRKRRAENHRFILSDFSVTLFGDGQIDRHERRLKGLFAKHKWDLVCDRFLQLPLFLKSLPMNFHKSQVDSFKMVSKLKTTVTSEPTNIMPLQGEYSGMSTPGVLLTGRQGQLYSFNPFGSEIDKRRGLKNLDKPPAKYNTSIIGTTGSGKSFFLNDLLISHLSLGGQVFMIDMGHSYKKLCQQLGGQYVEFGAKSNICLNPFKQYSSSFDQWDRLRVAALIRPVLLMMAKPTGKVHDWEQKAMSRAILDVLETKGNQASIDDLAQWFGSQDNAKYKEMAHLLFDYSTRGEYGYLFNQGEPLDFNNRFFVLELSELDNIEDLRGVVLQFLLIQIYQKVLLSSREDPTLLGMDEAWKFFENPKTAPFMRNFARTFRKYFGGLMLITQNISDMAQASNKVIWDNSAWKIVFHQEKGFNDRATDKDGKGGGSYVGLSHYQEEMIAGLKSEIPHWSELFLMGEHIDGVIGRLRVDPESALLYSSNANDDRKIRALRDKGLSLSDAIHQLAQERDVA